VLANDIKNNGARAHVARIHVVAMCNEAWANTTA